MLTGGGGGEVYNVDYTQVENPLRGGVGGIGHDPPCKATEGWWQQIALHLRQGSRNGGIRPGTAAHLSPAGDTVLHIDRILQWQNLARSHSILGYAACMLHRAGRAGQGRAGQGRAGR